MEARTSDKKNVRGMQLVCGELGAWEEVAK